MFTGNDIHIGALLLYELRWECIHFMLFKLTISLTDCIELDAAVSQVLWAEDDFVLRLSVSDQDTNFSGVWTQSYIGFEVVLKDVIQSHSCWTWIEGYIKLEDIYM